MRKDEQCRFNSGGWCLTHEGGRMHNDCDKKRPYPLPREAAARLLIEKAHLHTGDDLCNCVQCQNDGYFK